MKANVGVIDKAVRIVVGLAVLSLIFFLEGNARWWGLVGFIPLLTGVFGWCPAYLPFHISTCSTDKGKPVSA